MMADERHGGAGVGGGGAVRTAEVAEPVEPADGANHPISDVSELVRIATMLGRLSGELRDIDLDERGVDRLVDLHGEVLDMLDENLDDALVGELRRLVPVIGDGTGASEAEVRMAHVQLVSWLEGLFQGIQMSAAGQQVRRQLEQSTARPAPTTSGQAPLRPGAGTYL